MSKPIDQIRAGAGAPANASQPQSAPVSNSITEEANLREARRLAKIDAWRERFLFYLLWPVRFIQKLFRIKKVEAGPALTPPLAVATPTPPPAPAPLPAAPPALTPAPAVSAGAAVPPVPPVGAAITTPSPAVPPPTTPVVAAPKRSYGGVITVLVLVALVIAAFLVRWARLQISEIGWNQVIFVVFWISVLWIIGNLLIKAAKTKNYKPAWHAVVLLVAAVLLARIVPPAFRWYQGTGAALSTTGQPPASITSTPTPGAAAVPPPTLPPPASTTIPIVDPPGTKTLVLKTGEPKKSITVAQYYQWRLIDPPLDGWTTDKGRRDQNGNRFQEFELVGTATEVQLQVSIEPCPQQKCVW